MRSSSVGVQPIQMMTSNAYLQNELAVAIELARAAGAAVLDHYDRGVRVETKVGVDRKSEPVTAADHIANELIVRGIEKAFPDDGVLAEESLDTVQRLGRDRVWMIDPIDGTNGFIAGTGDFAVQIGLTVKGRAVLGVLFQPAVDTLYRAVEAQGTWIERPGFPPIRARVSEVKVVSEVRMAASRTHRNPKQDRLKEVLGISEEVKRGSVGVKVGLLVESQCDLYVHISSGTKQWDTCAPEVVLTEAGGKCTDLFGQRIVYNTPDIQNHNGLVASNGLIHAEVIERIQPLLTEFGRQPVVPD